MSTVSRLVLACVATCSIAAVAGVRTAQAEVITDPTGNVQIATGGDCAYGTVAVATTGCAFGGVAASGTGSANTDSDLTPVAVSGTGEAGGCGDLGAVAVSGTGLSEGCFFSVSGTGPACAYGASVEVTVLGSTCGSAPVQVCVRCRIPGLGGSWFALGTRRS